MEKQLGRGEDSGWDPQDKWVQPEGLHPSSPSPSIGENLLRDPKDLNDGSCSWKGRKYFLSISNTTI